MRRQIEVCTVCRGRVLNALYHAGVNAREVRAEGRSLFCEVSSRAVADAARCLDGMGMSYCVRRVGVSARLFALRRRPALWIGVLVAALAVIMALQVVWGVRVDCAESLRPAVQEALAEGYASPHWRGTVDTDALRLRLSHIQGVALVSVRVRGVFLEISLREELPQGVAEAVNGPIVAACDCIISRIVVERGRALVSVGQSVRRGDVLIAPEYLLDKDAAITAPATAVGVVYGYTYPSAMATYDERSTVTVRTGETAKSAQIVWDGVALSPEIPSPYAEYEAETTRIALGGLVPIEVVRTTYFRTETVVEFRPWAVARETVVEECFTQILSQLKKDVHLRRKWCIINTMGSIYSVRAYAEVEQTVGIYCDNEG